MHTAQPRHLYPNKGLHPRVVGEKLYELTDHLGNVRTTITDRKMATFDSNWLITGFTADITSANDYFPFGSEMPGRSYNSGEYRFGFNGMEKDDEVKGQGNSLDFGARIYDPRIGRWEKTDPLEVRFPSKSPYVSFNNNPLFFVDMDGREYFAYTRKTRQQTLTALKKVFGDTNGFKFEGSRLTHSGSEKLGDLRKEYVLGLFLKEVVNNSNNHVHLKNGGEVVGASDLYFSDFEEARLNAAAQGKSAFEIGGESTFTIISGEQTNTTIFIGGPVGIGEGSPEIKRDETMLLWHGIGHALTNYEHQIDGRLFNLQRATASRKTVGFENLIASFLNVVPRDGSNHGHTSVPGSSGSDSFYQNRAQSYERINQSSHNSGSGMFSVTQDELDIKP